MLPKKYYKISEVAEMFNIPTSTLRWWENEFKELKPKRTTTGQRRYTRADIEIIKRIHELLYVNGRKTESAKADITMFRRRKAPISFLCQTHEDALRLLSEAKTCTEDIQITKRIEAVIKYLEANDR